MSVRICELREWRQTTRPPLHVFADAAGKDAHLGAVLFCDGVWRWSHCDPPPQILQCFQRRRDKQIMGLELLAISFAISTFEPWIRGRRVVVHCDNKGAEVRPISLFPITASCACHPKASVRRGAARTWDHAQLVHAQWWHCALIGVHLHIKRVSTSDNIADLPSRRVCSFPFTGAVVVDPLFFVRRTSGSWWIKG